MVGAAGGSADDIALDWHEVEGDEDREALVLARWIRLIRLYRRIRRQQRIWHNLGQALQNVDRAARERVQKVWPPSRR